MRLRASAIVILAVAALGLLDLQTWHVLGLLALWVIVWVYVVVHVLRWIEGAPSR